MKIIIVYAVFMLTMAFNLFSQQFLDNEEVLVCYYVENDTLQISQSKKFGYKLPTKEELKQGVVWTEIILLYTAKVKNDTLEFCTSYNSHGNCGKYQVDLKKRLVTLSWFNENPNMGVDKPHTVSASNAPLDKKEGEILLSPKVVDKVLAYLKKKGKK